MPNALDQYRLWKAQKNQIIGQLLKELAGSISEAAEMSDAFTPDEIKVFVDFHDRLMELQNKYPVVAAGHYPSVQQAAARRPIQRKYTDETPQCEGLTGKGERCTFPSVPHTHLCAKHTPKPE